MEQKAQIANSSIQQKTTAKGSVDGWKYEIDKEYEKQLIAYISYVTNNNVDSIVPGSPKIGAPDFFKHLHYLEVPESVKRIGPFAFAGCNKLKYVNFKGCEIVSNNAFWKCSKLTHAHFPMLKIVQSFSFCGAGVDAPCFVMYTPEVNSLEANSFNNCGAQVLYFPKLTNMPTRTIVKCPKLQDISIPNVITMSDGAIIGNKELTSIYAPNLKYFNERQVDNYANLNLFIISQQAKQALVRKAEDGEVPECFLSISEYHKDSSNKPKRN